MSCNVTKFVITKGSDNTFTFRIKQDNSTLPLIIEPSDTFSASLATIGVGDGYAAITDKPLTIVDVNNGEIALNIPAADTLDLVTDIGGKVDRYYSRATYKLTLNCSTVNNGDFIAKVPEVYVD